MLLKANAFLVSRLNTSSWILEMNRHLRGNAGGDDTTWSQWRQLSPPFRYYPL